MKVNRLSAYDNNSNPIISNVSFNAKAGEVIAIVGKSGAGKTTLLKALSGVGIETSGTVCDLEKIGFLYQNGKESLSPAYSIISQAMENVGNRKGAEKWFSKVGLTDKINSYSQMLSGGQRMRACLAINMHHNPNVLLLDEPTASLDSANVKIAIDILTNKAKQDNTLLLWVTHDMQLAKQISSRVMVMDNGQLVEDSPASLFFKQPTTAQGQYLLKKSLAVANAKVENKVVCAVKKISAGYGKNIIFKDISFDVKQGQALGVYGHSGVGKTTLLRVLSGEVKALSGQIKKPNYVQVIFQDALSALNPALSVFESIAEPIVDKFSKDIVKKNVYSILTDVGIDPSQAVKKPHQFSGGEAMRICIARAMISGAKLILADEITSSLDSITATTILKTLVKLQAKTGTAIIFVSHDKNAINQISHKTLEM